MGIKASNKISAGFSLSSMTDLVFLLLIFFVIVSTMVSPFALPVDLPKGRTTSSKEPPKVALRLESAETVTLNGKPIPAESIEAYLHEEMGKHADNDAIILHVAQDVPTGQMVSVLDIAKRYKWRIVLASAPTPPGEQPPTQ
ncbi:MAG: biopolymer transporter ExbD [Flavobacteriales bacterium]